MRAVLRALLCLQRRQERLDAHDVHHSGEIVGEDVQRHFRGNPRRVFIKKCVAPIRAFIVPNGCSTVSRRWRIFSRCSSSRRCTASITCSCSHREISRSLAVVQRCLMAQCYFAPRRVTQGRSSYGLLAD